jgi:hypothetical protein
VVLADDVESDSIVLLGHFNPGLIQPNWLETQGLFEGREIKVGDAIVTPPVTTLNLGWLVVEVLEQRASFTTTEEATSAGLLRDFVVDLFRILEHTPVSAIGMNQFQHFGLPDGAWDRLIAKLGPSDLLQDALPGAATKSLRWDAPREDGLAVTGRSRWNRPSDWPGERGLAGTRTSTSVPTSEAPMPSRYWSSGGTTIVVRLLRWRIFCADWRPKVDESATTLDEFYAEDLKINGRQPFIGI